MNPVTKTVPTAVAAAAIVNECGEVLISKRAAHLHQGGLWEFPGGKLEPGEDSHQALQRELREELGIEVERARPLIRVHHDYPDRSVVLHVWRVDAFRGKPRGRQGQPVVWVQPEALLERAFPEANRPLVNAVRLPSRYLITPEPGGDVDRFFHTLEQSLQSGVELVQLRAKSFHAGRYRALACRALEVLRPYSARLLLNSEPALVEELGAAGVHLAGTWLGTLASRPLGQAYWVAASCHGAEELAQARRVGVDFAVLSPVRATTSHPGAAPLGWQRFAELVEHAPMPVFALGGIGPQDLDQAFCCGAQGIAAIRGLWGEGATLRTLV